MRNAKVGIGCLFLILICHLTLSPYFGRKVYLVATEELSVFAETNPSEQSEPILKLPPGSEYKVISCVDTKSDIIPKIKLNNGITAFVTGPNKYVVRYHPFSFFELPSFTWFSCYPLLNS